LEKIAHPFPRKYATISFSGKPDLMEDHLITAFIVSLVINHTYAIFHTAIIVTASSVNDVQKNAMIFKKKFVMFSESHPMFVMVVRN